MVSLLFPQLSVVAIIMNITRTAMVGSFLKDLLENHTSHPSFESLANLQVQFNNVAAVIVFFSWVKVKIFSPLIHDQPNTTTVDVNELKFFFFLLSFLSSSTSTRP